MILICHRTTWLSVGTSLTSRGTSAKDHSSPHPPLSASLHLGLHLYCWCVPPHSAAPFVLLHPDPFTVLVLAPLWASTMYTIFFSGFTSSRRFHLTRWLLLPEPHLTKPFSCRFLFPPLLFPIFLFIHSIAPTFMWVFTFFCIIFCGYFAVSLFCYPIFFILHVRLIWNTITVFKHWQCKLDYCF